jgi:outer membrane lipoprotein-sorting protein
MKKRTLWCLLASLIVVGVLVAGCNKSSPTTTNNSATVATQGQPGSSPTASAQSKPGSSQWIAGLFTELKQGRGFKADFTETTFKGAVSSGTMWKQNDTLKMATTIKGIPMVMIIDYAAKTMVSYRTDTGKGYKMSLPAEYASENLGNYWNNVDPATVQDLGTQSVNGQPCHGIQYSINLYGFSDTVKMWLDEKLDFPVQIVTTTPNGQTGTMNFTNIQLGTLPSDTFSVPAGITIRDMASMTQPAQ